MSNSNPFTEYLHRTLQTAKFDLAYENLTMGDMIVAREFFGGEAFKDMQALELVLHREKNPMAEDEISYLTKIGDTIIILITIKLPEGRKELRIGIVTKTDFEDAVISAESMDEFQWKLVYGTKEEEITRECVEELKAIVKKISKDCLIHISGRTPEKTRLYQEIFSDMENVMVS